MFVSAQLTLAVILAGLTSLLQMLNTGFVYVYLLQKRGLISPGLKFSPRGEVNKWGEGLDTIIMPTIVTKQAPVLIVMASEEGLMALFLGMCAILCCLLEQ